MNSKNLLLFEENKVYIFYPIIGILLILFSVYITINLPHSLTLLAVLTVGIIGIFSYKIFLAVVLFLITFIIEGDFILHIGLGLKIREGFTIHPIDLIFAYTVFMFILRQCLQYGKKIEYPKIVSLIILAFVIIGFGGFIRGVSVYGLKNAAWDARYVFFFLSFFIAYEFLDTEEKWRILFKIILVALALHALLLLGLSIIRDIEIIPEEIWLMSFTEMGPEGRVGSSNGTFLIGLLPFLLFFKDWFIKQRLIGRLQWWLFVGSFIVLTLMSMGRVVFFCILINLIILSMLRTKYLLRFGLTFIGISIFIILLIATIPHFRLLLEGYTERVTDFEYLWQSGLCRILSFTDGLNLFLNNKLFGTGFGSTMNLIGPTGEVASEGLFIDNAFATILAKTGISGGIPFAFLSLIPLGLLFSLIHNTFDKNKQLMYKGLIFMYPVVWFSLTMPSAHLIHSRVTIVLFSLLLAFLERNLRKERSCQRK